MARIEEEQISRIEKGIEKDCHGGIETIICTCPSIVCLAQKVENELIGTYFIIFSGCGVVVVNVLYGGKVTFPGICVTWVFCPPLLIVMVMTYSVGHISGAHFNPAVTICFAIFRRFPWYQVPSYIGAQLAGSLLASLTLRLMFKVTAEAFFGTTPADSAARVLVSEITICSSSYRRISWNCGRDDNNIERLCSRTDIWSINESSKKSRTSYCMGVYKGIWVYIVGPIIGIVAGGFVYNFIRFTDKPLGELTKSSSFLRKASGNNNASSSNS
ncbi:hypothetical protein Bca52824_046348 [Brassica carinata]|uniref:Uncharacterized protein n=1 Tax=Brassica carinata TaxID=52824 RepID=A0A8X7RCQ3_BRACI|nr:hypothetical protein Bca52824_046348 [Brassica carinata]